MNENVEMLLEGEIPDLDNHGHESDLAFLKELLNGGTE